MKPSQAEKVAAAVRELALAADRLTVAMILKPANKEKTVKELAEAEKALVAVLTDESGYTGKDFTMPDSAYPKERTN